MSKLNISQKGLKDIYHFLESIEESRKNRDIDVEKMLKIDKRMTKADEEIKNLRNLFDTEADVDIIINKAKKIKDILINTNKSIETYSSCHNILLV